MEKLLVIERKMISAKYDGKKLRYLYYKKKYKKLKEKLDKVIFYKK